MATIMIACATSYYNCSCDISIPLDCYVVKECFISNCDDRTATVLVGRGPAYTISCVGWIDVNLTSFTVRHVSRFYETAVCFRK